MPPADAEASAASVRGEPDELDRLAPSVLPGVGPARRAAFARLGVHTLRDLLLLLPRRHEVAGTRCRLDELAAHRDELVRVRGTVSKVRSFRRGPRRSTLRFRLEDDGGAVDVVLFNQPWRIPRAREWAARAEEVHLEARVTEHAGALVLASPRFDEGGAEWPAEGSVVAVYPAVDGLGQRVLVGAKRAALETYGHLLVEELPRGFREEHGLPELDVAVRALDAGRADVADRRRVALESLLALQAGLLAARDDRTAAPPVRTAVEEARGRSPHLWTPGQEHAITTILGDLARPRPMRRLLQGDVGAGKTLVAQCVADAVVRAGGQVALMAPTETLAEQHFASLAPWFRERGARVELLTGSVGAAARRATRAALADGSVDLAIGTQALVSEGVAFARLRLGIVDEEQRFGVAQRSTLFARGAHALVMTATPIPRSLALTLYGDWDVVRLEGFPPGRGGRRTRVAGRREVGRAERTALERLEAGESVFWIVPRITGEDRSIEEAEARLGASPLAEHGLEVVHGRLAAAERHARLERFRRGTSRLLVGTTVVEVGVDVPAATLLVVEGAERFGLAQLHQLRGRVGRGPRPALAVFLSTTSARGRIEPLERTEDGFEIAEEDLRQRGMGELLGRRQSGWSATALEEVVDDHALVAATRTLLRGRPDLAARYRRRGRRGN